MLGHNNGFNPGAVRGVNSPQREHPAGKENTPSVLTQSNLANKTSPNNTQAGSMGVSFDELRKNLTCGICNSLLASSLVLSCGHIFCGHCLFESLNVKASCPTCQVGLRAIPARVLAVDGIAQAASKCLPKDDADAFQLRFEEGKSAANKLNKMFWWLQPSAVPVGGDGPLMTLQGGSMQQQSQAPAGRQKQQRSNQFGNLPLSNNPQHIQQRAAQAQLNTSGYNFSSTVPLQPQAPPHSQGMQMQGGRIHQGLPAQYPLMDLGLAGNAPNMPQLSSQLNNLQAQAQLQQILQSLYLG